MQSFLKNTIYHLCLMSDDWLNLVSVLLKCLHQLLYFTGSQRYGSQTTGLTNATWASMTGQQGRRLSWLQGMFFLLLCVSSITAFYLYFKPKKQSFSGVLWQTSRILVWKEREQVGLYDKDWKPGWNAGLQARDKACLITQKREFSSFI